MAAPRFPIKGYVLRDADTHDDRYLKECMEKNILLSVSDTEKEYSDMWMDDIMSVTSIAMEDRLMRSEIFILENNEKERNGMLWLGISRDEFTCEETGYLLGVFVNEELRRKGIGKELVNCAEHWCREKGMIAMTLNVGSENKNAKDFYEHLEFKERSSVMRIRLR
ncbi:MAG: GNAT family N-acetyltransferase [Methanomassiliicoccaceae archaeon]|nr:GNAT family N-acetyltransferase [Methanomassiliicoccaceae archaeon]